MDDGINDISQDKKNSRKRKAEEQLLVMSPCKNCVMRTIGCHSWCLEYMDYAEKKEKEKQEQLKHKAGYDTYKAFKDSVFLKVQRRRMKKG